MKKGHIIIIIKNASNLTIALIRRIRNCWKKKCFKTDKNKSNCSKRQQ